MLSVWIVITLSLHNFTHIPEMFNKKGMIYILSGSKTVSNKLKCKFKVKWHTMTFPPFPFVNRQTVDLDPFYCERPR